MIQSAPNPDDLDGDAAGHASHNHYYGEDGVLVIYDEENPDGWIESDVTMANLKKAEE